MVSLQHSRYGRSRPFVHWRAFFGALISRSWLIAAAIDRAVAAPEARMSFAVAVTFEVNLVRVGTEGGSSGPRSAEPRVDGVVHLTCFDGPPGIRIGGGDARASAEGEIEAEKGSCCQRLSLALQWVCDSPPTVPPDPLAADGICREVSDPHHRVEWIRRCVRSIAAVPAAAASATMETSAPWLLLPSLYLSSPVLGTERRDRDGGGGTVSAAMGRRRYAQFATRSPEGSEGAMGGDEDGGGWYDDAPSPFHLSSSFLRLLSGGHGSSVTVPAGGSLRGSVSWSLSGEGGLHRSYRHTVELSLLGNKDDEKNTGRQAVLLNGTAMVLLPMSEGVYIDADDPFQDRAERTCQVIISKGEKSGFQVSSGWDGTCDLEFIQAPGAIDVEQPSFASPQHVVAFRISVSATSNSYGGCHDTLPGAAEVLSVQMEFFVSLHVRYQLPIATESDRVKHYVSVYVPTPILNSGEITLHNLDGTVQRVNELRDISQGHGETENNILTLQAAAGRDADYLFVALVTMLSGILGAIIMMRDISQVSTWC